MSTTSNRRKRRDMYRGQIDDFGDRGAMPASHDLYAVLVILTGYARKSHWREEWVEVGKRRDGSSEVMTVGQLLQIASDAYTQSINEVVFVYRQLLANADAADALAQVIDVAAQSDRWRTVCDALTATLNQRPLAKRGLVNAVKRELAAREAER